MSSPIFGPTRRVYDIRSAADEINASAPYGRYAYVGYHEITLVEARSFGGRVSAKAAALTMTDLWLIGSPEELLSLADERLSGAAETALEQEIPAEGWTWREIASRTDVRLMRESPYGPPAAVRLDTLAICAANTKGDGPVPERETPSTIVAAPSDAPLKGVPLRGVAAPPGYGAYDGAAVHTYYSPNTGDLAHTHEGYQSVIATVPPSTDVCSTISAGPLELRNGREVYMNGTYLGDIDQPGPGA